MSAKVIIEELDSIDEAREVLIEKLPWWRRFIRRYMTGDAFKAYNISSAMTWPTAFGTGLGASKMWAGWVTTHPVATGFLTKCWGTVTSVLAAAWGIVTHTS